MGRRYLLPFLAVAFEGVASAGAQTMPVVQNNGELKALAVPPSAGVVYRSGFATAGDGGDMTYRYVPSACATGRGAGDDGAEVKPARGAGCWVATFSQGANARVWGALGAPASTDDTGALQRALTWACGPQARALRIAAGRYYHTGLTIRGSCHIFGDGRGETLLQQQSNTASDIVVRGTGSEKVTLSDMFLIPAVKKIAGYAIEFHQAYFPTLERVDLTGWNGVLDDSSASMTVANLNMSDLNGVYGIKFIGHNASPAAVFGAILDNVVGSAKNNRHLTWLDMDSYSYSVTLKSGIFMYGAKCIVMEDTAAVQGGASVPKWLFVPHLECDHPFETGVHLIKGQNVTIAAGSWIGSSQTGNGIATEPGWSGGLTVSGTRINGNLLSGVLLGGGRDIKMMENEITANGQGRDGIRHDELTVGREVSDLKIVNNFISREGHDNSAVDRFCISIDKTIGGHLYIVGNSVYGCSAGSIEGSPVGPHVRISANDGQDY